MTESEWLVSENPGPMLDAVSGTNGDHPDRSVYGQAPRPLSRRKRRLFACGCCRLCWPFLTDARSRRAVEVAERFADGEVGDQDLRGALRDAYNAWGRQRQNFCVAFLPWSACAPAIGSEFGSTFFGSLEVGNVPPAAQAALLRCIAGNPYKPVTIYGPDWSAWRRWRTRDVLNLAEAAYRSGRPCPRCKGKPPRNCPVCHGYGTDGLLDPFCLALLSDALEGAGCESKEVLTHLRSSSPHAKGCHVLECILGRE